MDLLYENIFANYIYDEGIVSKYVKNSYSSTIDKQPNVKMDKQLEQTFPQTRYADSQQAHGKVLSIISH